MTKDQEHGRAYGRLVWRGNSKPKDRQIGAALKKEWSLLELPNYKLFKGTENDIAKLIPPRIESSIAADEPSDEVLEKADAEIEVKA